MDKENLSGKAMFIIAFLQGFFLAEGIRLKPAQSKYLRDNINAILTDDKWDLESE